jgi:cell wall-associated NlpC family hydrolase
MGELKPGDLVFFSKKKGRKKITHVGMVTSVQNRKEIRFIHSSTKLGVVENNLMSNYYQGIFVKARRPF